MCKFRHSRIKRRSMIQFFVITNWKKLVIIMVGRKIDIVKISKEQTIERMQQAYFDAVKWIASEGAKKFLSDF